MSRSVSPVDAQDTPANGVEHSAHNEPLSAARTVGLGAILAGVFTVALLIVGLMAALGGYVLSEVLGIVTVDQLIAPVNIIIVVFLSSIVLAFFVCFSIYRTFGMPLRQMTQAMRHLANGDFSFRLQSDDRFALREVKEFTKSFNTAAAELEGTEMMRAGFISDFSHEFRTPIASLSGFAQLLLEEDLPEEEKREYLEIIHEEAQRLSGLSERILLLSKMEASTILPDVSCVNIAEQLRRCIMLLEPKLTEKAVRIDLSLDECIVQGNADHLAQLWLNLLDNAVKFSPEGGRVSIASYGGRGDEEERVISQDLAVVWISDEGVGMNGETMDRIFDRFYQGDTSHASKGSGLGLALCKRIVELHDGSIDVQSTLGQGTVFEVRLPLGTKNPR